MTNNTEDSKTRIRTIRKLCISYPRLNSILKFIEGCRADSPELPEPRCCIITGAPGVGKTIASRLFESQHPTYDDDEKGQTIVPVLSALIPAKASEKAIVTSMLESLGDPAPDKGSTVSQTLRLKKLMRACRTQIVILDEFQHIIDTESAKILSLSADWLKMLLNETNIPVILVGMPGCLRILQDNTQLQRRYEDRFEIEPFAWSRTINGFTSFEFRQAVGQIDNLLPFKESSNLRDYDIAYPLYCATGGVIHSIMKIISNAAEKAVNLNLDNVPRELLEEACDKFISVRAPTYQNPFSVSVKTLKPIPLSVLTNNILKDKV